MNKYTDDSVKASSPMMGITLIVIGVMWVVARLGSFIPALASFNSTVLLLIGVAGAVVFGLLGARKLVKK